MDITLGSYGVDKFGRKVTIMLSSAPYVIGSMIIAGKRSEVMLLLGRIVTDLAVGAVLLAVPVRTFSNWILPQMTRAVLVSRTLGACWASPTWLPCVNFTVTKLSTLVNHHKLYLLLVFRCVYCLKRHILHYWTRHLHRLIYKDLFWREVLELKAY